jgi:NADH-quinone oxidoreductase subunit N
MIVAALTATLGNLAALGQTQLKRMLAYSTIAHAGYMLMGLATMSQDGGAATLYYLAAYLPTNLGAFAVVALVRNRTGREDLEAYRGLMTQAPFLAIGLTVFLLSLLGLPPLAGFAGKFQIFSAVYHSGQGAVLPGAYWALLGVGLINTVISAGYYLKVLRVVAFEEPSGEWKPGSLAGNGLIGLLVVAVVALGVFWNPVLDRTTRAMDRPVTFNPAKP